MGKFLHHQIVLKGREMMSISLELSDASEIISAKLFGIGGPDFLRQLKNWRKELKGPLQKISLPTGRSVGELMYKQLLLRARGEWDYPYKEAELCHCRAVPTEVVDAAILVGAHTANQVSRDTSASTACGTCRPDVEAILKFIL